MVITKDLPLPTYEELDCEEIALGGHVLKAGSNHFGKYCEQQNDEYMLCKHELGIIPCMGYGKEVTACALEFFRKLKKHCYEELERYSYCLEKSSCHLRLHECRKTQKVFDDCVLRELNIERPPYYYYTRPRAFDDLNRPAPTPKPPLVFEKVPDAPTKEEGFPDQDYPGKFGARFWWW